jgi:hypothetical protein
MRNTSPRLELARRIGPFDNQNSKDWRICEELFLVQFDENRIVLGTENGWTSREETFFERVKRGLGFK